MFSHMPQPPALPPDRRRTKRETADQPTRGYLTLGEIADRTPTLEVACSRCDRRGRYQTASLIRQIGRDKPATDWLREISADCPRRLDPSPSIQELCGIHCPDLPKLFLT
jgi:hypothetical protein